ncbi:MAG: hypothetical protein RDU14_17395 [Melioribacteraceae bacterium]|nr:hypothetical protein [Melioribacteraceae bacterium]
MITFNFDQFLLDKRLGLYELASKTSIPVQTLYAVKNRGTVKMKFIRRLEKKFGDLTPYITITKQENGYSINSEQLLPQKETV